MVMKKEPGMKQVTEGETQFVLILFAYTNDHPLHLRGEFPLRYSMVQYCTRNTREST
jgi:hypothetical protein